MGIRGMRSFAAISDLASCCYAHEVWEAFHLLGDGSNERNWNV